MLPEVWIVESKSLPVRMDNRVVAPAAEWLGLKLCGVCDVLCLRDGVQDEPLF